MGTIRERPSGFRAEVKRQGLRRSATLETRELAERWIAATEAIVVAPRDLMRLSKPARCGAVYVLLDVAGAVLYVGRTGDLHRRLVRHRENGLVYARYFAIEMDDPAARAKREAELVRELLPPLNRIRFKVGAPRAPRSALARRQHAKLLAMSVQSKT